MILRRALPSFRLWNNGVILTRVFRNRLIRGFYDRNSGALFCDLEFVQCRFEHCFFGTLRDVTRRPTARKISLIDCDALSCTVRGSIIEDVRVNGLDSEGNLILWAPAFRHVTLTGRICDLIVNMDEDPAGEYDPCNAEFRKANAEFYATIDWALDISKAEFRDVDIRGVPAGLVRRDPETQVVIKRERVLQSAWRELDLSETHWATSIEWFLDRGEPDNVLIAPKRAHNFRKLLSGLRLLQRAGVAEPD